MNATDAARPFLERVVDRRLGRNGRGLGHPVADRNLGHVHLGLHALHHFDGTRRTCHDPGAQRAELVRFEIRQRELSDEHRRDAVERGAVLLLHRVERERRLEGGTRNDDRRTVGDDREIAQHHAEAVVERNRDADPVALRIAAAFPDEVPVVEDVVMREGRALGETGRARGVLNVDRFVELRRREALGEFLRRHVLAGEVDDVVPAQRVERRVEFVLADQHDVAQVGQTVADLRDHLHVGARLVADLRQQHADPALAQRVSDFRGPVRRIDVDQNRAELRGRELCDHPLDVVRRPDADAVAVPDAEPDQTAREFVACALQFAVGHAKALVERNDRIVCGVRGRDAVERGADRLTAQRFGARTARITQLGHARALRAQRGVPLPPWGPNS